MTRAPFHVTSTLKGDSRILSSVDLKHWGTACAAARLMLQINANTYCKCAQ